MRMQKDASRHFDVRKLIVRIVAVICALVIIGSVFLAVFL